MHRGYPLVFRTTHLYLSVVVYKIQCAKEGVGMCPVIQQESGIKDTGYKSKDMDNRVQENFAAVDQVPVLNEETAGVPDNY